MFPFQLAVNRIVAASSAEKVDGISVGQEMNDNLH